ncbi:MAG TPA: arginine--tRNA ligase [Candidatus Sumerlaeota bacterium]|nr:arginine--tRNA ligase [Candidatus Sumerlaeota bacterium]
MEGNVRETLAGLVQKGIETYAAGLGIEPGNPAILIERPKVRDFGDYGTNAAMQMARVFRKSPLEIARGIQSAIPPHPLVREVTVAAPGFLNFHLNTGAGAGILKTICEKGEAFGRPEIGAGRKVMVEFMSANPTGPLHIGHARNAILGDSIARVLEAAGYNVTREYYYNDAGVQMKKLGESLQARYLQTLGRDVSFPEDGYQGDYMKGIAADLAAERCDTLAAETDTAFFTKYAADRIIKLIDADMKSLGINFDVWFSETSLHRDGKVEQALDELRRRGHVYEKDGAWWLDSARFGDEKDRVVIKSDGEKTYLAPDIAYHKDKFDRGHDILINLFGGDHHGYVSRLKAGIQALGYNPDAIHCIVFQMVTLLKDGETIKLSTRAGKFITLKEAIDELGPDVVRFFFLMRSADSQMTFDWQLAKDHSMNNPVFYVQYAHARCCSLFKKADEFGISWDGPAQADMSLLSLPEEEEVIRVLEQYPQILRLCAESLEPHHMTIYLRDLAAAFHALFTCGTRDESKRFLVPDNPALTQARLTLVTAIRQVLSSALTVIGITPMQSM